MAEQTAAEEWDEIGGAFDEAAALAVPREIHLVEMKPVRAGRANKAKPQRDFERVRAERLFQTGDAILAPVQFHEPRIAAADEVCTHCAWRRGRRRSRSDSSRFLFSRPLL